LTPVSLRNLAARAGRRPFSIMMEFRAALDDTIFTEKPSRSERSEILRHQRWVPAVSQCLR
jgi:hypothetical protein